MINNDQVKEIEKEIRGTKREEKGKEDQTNDHARTSSSRFNTGFGLVNSFHRLFHLN